MQRKSLSGACFLGHVTTLEDMVRRTFEEIMRVYNTQAWYEKISNFFTDRIQQIDLFGVAVSFQPS